jgi:phospholipid/cholesterol/gamma-HCH transport system substrate-binding protein
METRANYALIGLFTLAVLAASFFFVFWFSGKDAGGKTQTYRIIFTGSVSGLSRGANVLYNGLKVGEVTSLSFATNDPNRVVARVDIDASTPMNVDTRARLEFQGLTGVASIQLSGGKPDSAPLDTKDPAKPPIIYADRSDFQDLLETAQRLARRADDVLNKADQLFSDNAASINQTVKNVESFTGALAANSGGIDKFLSSTGNAADKIAALSENLQSLSTTAERIIAGVNPDDVNKIITDLRQVTDTVAQDREKITAVLNDAATLASRLNETSVKLDGVISDVGSAVKGIDGAKLARTLDNVDRFSTALANNSGRVEDVLKNADELSGKLNKASDRIDGVLADASSALKGVDATLKGIDPAKVSRTLDNIDKFAAAIGDNTGRVDETLRNASELTAKLNNSADRVDDVLKSAQKFLGSEQTQGALNEVADMARSIRKLADNLDKRTAEITTGINRVTGPALRDYEALASDGRRTLTEINRTLRSFQSNPQQLLFGQKSSIPEYQGRQ